MPGAVYPLYDSSFARSRDKAILKTLWEDDEEWCVIHEFRTKTKPLCRKRFFGAEIRCRIAA